MYFKPKKKYIYKNKTTNFYYASDNKDNKDLQGVIINNIKKALIDGIFNGFNATIS